VRSILIEKNEPVGNYSDIKTVFIALRAGKNDIWTMNSSDGGNQTRLTQNAADNYFPGFSPNGGQIAFMSTRTGNAEIYVMNFDGTNPTRVTNNLVYDSFPSWGR